MSVWRELTTPLNSYERDRRILQILGWGMGGLMLITGLSGIAFMQYFFATAAKAEGEVTVHIRDGASPAGEISRRNRSAYAELTNPRILTEKMVRLMQNKEFYSPQISYSIGSQGYSFVAEPLSTIYIEDRWAVGSSMTVYYDPANPGETARVRGFDYEWVEPLKYIALGATLLAIMPQAIKQYDRRRPR